MPLAAEINRRAEHWGRRGQADLRIQLIKAADSISANIVEGAGHDSNKDFARFLGYSIKSANETEHHLAVAYNRALLPHDVWARLSNETVEIRKMIYSYREKVKSSNRPC